MVACYAKAESVKDFYYTVSAYFNGVDGLEPIENDGDDDFEKGRMYCIIGKSGSGKTALLSLLSGLAVPNSGDIIFEGKSILEIDKYTFRSRYIGVVFQSFNLITKYTALENVILSMDVSGAKIKNKKERALELLESVGLDEDEADRRVLKLSGGQQQMVAIARALRVGKNIWQKENNKSSPYRSCGIASS